MNTCIALQNDALIGSLLLINIWVFVLFILFVCLFVCSFVLNPQRNIKCCLSLWGTITCWNLIRGLSAILWKNWDQQNRKKRIRKIDINYRRRKYHKRMTKINKILSPCPLTVGLATCWNGLWEDLYNFSACPVIGSDQLVSLHWYWVTIKGCNSLR